ncbi:hypothetical protein [Endozoicomonas ascidiicola]|uniref:hypothetical protein n=1 Tax=Endozoicomonas ascidiicola TaxID=1698521 RepID=UPI00082F21B9|nr:hypothetical protein [Endozoicomonas ascidiicola]
MKSLILGIDENEEFKAYQKQWSELVKRHSELSAGPENHYISIPEQTSIDTMTPEKMLDSTLMYYYPNIADCLLVDKAPFLAPYVVPFRSIKPVQLNINPKDKVRLAKEIQILKESNKNSSLNQVMNLTRIITILTETLKQKIEIYQNGPDTFQADPLKLLFHAQVLNHLAILFSSHIKPNTELHNKFPLIRSTSAIPALS